MAESPSPHGRPRRCPWQNHCRRTVGRCRCQWQNMSRRRVGRCRCSRQNHRRRRVGRCRCRWQNHRRHACHRGSGDARRRRQQRQRLAWRPSRRRGLYHRLRQRHYRHRRLQPRRILQHAPPQLRHHAPHERVRRVNTVHLDELLKVLQHKQHAALCQLRRREVLAELKGRHQAFQRQVLCDAALAQALQALQQVLVGRT
eukprot:259068-Chlamydomonas_euryale.AAC.1